MAAAAVAVPREFAPNPGLEHRNLNPHERTHAPQYYAAISKIVEIRERYIKDRFVFVESAAMVPILKGLGAQDEHFEAIQTVSDGLRTDPTLPFRESKNGRFCFDLDTRSVRRLEFQPFALSVEEDFKRHDSGQIRRFEEIGNDLQLNTVFQALLLFKFMVFHGVQTHLRQKLDYNSHKWISTVFNLRTVTTSEILGEPALEGVHTDGVDHTMTTYLGSRNMDPRSCVTFMHYNEEQTGIDYEETTAKHMAGRVHHLQFLDTLIIVDNERKHSLSPLEPIDPRVRATRDMLIFFTRKPVTKGHISEHLDSPKPHLDMPMEFPLWFP
ncbi:2OG-Fe dioxygenase family protein [Aspergillus clavatus NRRL 1]|uniref:2OG-Fe dioxygenase-domain-containing protein n=1 Tax=Aspergillus clavatus (strain ATCC 1007 / CBS 513.65 / DSM 816 / NCTC 3887 / NRRL 1 / QM 1276 / 107) TaxID=344612 RepID=A1CCW3_ASPCL|nr:uncharacterized protein ACLA_063370 [Aspergillus clavatus NRRL 1]EAW12370.1 conserved hypothetical protein [Aspergillus clavatus NRRL 1]